MRKRINNTRFSIRLCEIAYIYGWKTIGQAHKALSMAMPSAKFCIHHTHVRATRLLRELDAYLAKES